MSVLYHLKRAPDHLVEPEELRRPEHEGGSVDPGGDGEDGGDQVEVEDWGVPPVEDGEDHDPAHEEGEQHHESIDHIEETLLDK